MDAQSVEISRLNAEVGRLKQAITLSIQDFDKQNGGVALTRLREAIAPKPLVHVLRFPATAEQLQSLCGVRKFSQSDVLVGTIEQARVVLAVKKNDPCEACMKESGVK
jgi:hypothetical protein